MLCVTKNNKLVTIAYICDCCENEGGYYVQIYNNDLYDEVIDDFCIHKEDCNCENLNEVENYIKEYVKNLVL